MRVLIKRFKMSPDIYVDTGPGKRLRRGRMVTSVASILAFIQVYFTLVSEGSTQNSQEILAVGNSRQTTNLQTIPKEIFINQLLLANSLVDTSSKPANQFQLQNLLNQQLQQNNTNKQVLKEQTNAPQIGNRNGTNVPRRAIVITSSSTVNNITNLPLTQQHHQQPDLVASLGSSKHNLSVSNVRQKWRHMERSLGETLYQFARNFKQTLDEVSPNSISATCRVSLLEFIEALKEQKLWANKMADASAKLPSGLLEGTLTELGNFDQCLAINYLAEAQVAGEQQVRSKYMQQSSMIKGQYCSIQIKPYLTPRPRLHTVCQRLPQLSASNNQTSWRLLSQQSHQFHYVGLRLGICIPNKCSKLDIQQILSSYLAKYELLGQVKSCQTGAALSTTFDESASTKEVAGLDFVQQCIVSTFVILLVLVLIGTLLDYLLQLKNNKTQIMNSAKKRKKKKIESESEDSCLKPSPKRVFKTSVNSKSQTDCKIIPLGSTVQRNDRIYGGAKRWQYQVYRGAFPRCALHDNHQGLRQRVGDEICEINGLDCIDGCESDLKLQKNPLVDHLMPLDREGCSMPLSDTSNHLSDGNRIEEAWISELERNEFDNLATTISNSPNEIGKRKQVVENQQNLKVIGKQSNSNPENQGDMGDIKVIHGLRTLTMIWIIFGHTIGLVSPEMMNNLFSLAQTSCSSRFLQAILNATLAVNTFFMISGLVTVLSFARKCASVLPLIDGCKTGTTLSHGAKTTIIVDDKQAAKDKQQQQQQQRGNNYHSELEVSSTDSSSIISSLSSLDSSNKCINTRHKSAPARESRPLACQLSPSNPIDTARKSKSKTTCQQSTKSSSSFTWPNDFKPLIWLIMRYLRLTPAYTAVIGVSVVLPAFGSGPFWQESINQMGLTCRRNWWINVTYLNNFIETDKLCLIHSWYLSNDWQFFSLTLILFGIFYKSKRVALLLIVSLIISASAATFASTVSNDFPPTIVTTSPAIAERWLFIHSLYYKPWPHLSSYLIGLLTGYLIVIKDRLYISEMWRILIWLLISLVALALLNSIYPWNMGIPVEPLLAGLHSATFRTLWATCCAWLIFALVTKPHNPLAKFLSWQGFQLTSRLTYCAYLVHPLIIYYHFGTLRERLDSSIYGQFHRFMATLGLSYLFALLLSLIVESPSIQLQHFLSNLGSKMNISSGYDNMDRSCEDKEDHEQLMVKKRTNSATTNTTTITSNSWSATSSFSEQNSDVSFVTGTGNGGAANSELFKALSVGGASVMHNTNSKHLETAIAASLSQVIHLSESPKNFIHNKNNNEAQPVQNIEKPNGQAPVERKKPHEFSQSSISALDADFQQKLAQAISRGFRIRSQIANATIRKGATSADSNNNSRTAISRRPQSVASQETEPDFRRQQQQTMKTSNYLQRKLSTFAPPNRHHKQTNKLATGKDNSIANERRKSHDLSMMNDLQISSNNNNNQAAARSKELASQHNLYNTNVAANLNDIILMKQRLLSKSQSQIDAFKRSGSISGAAIVDDDKQYQ